MRGLPPRPGCPPHGFFKSKLKSQKHAPDLNRGSKPQIKSKKYYIHLSFPRRRESGKGNVPGLPSKMDSGLRQNDNPFLSFELQP
jgi:hypothetical protein